MACNHRAVLIITRQLEGTASSVAKSRVELACTLPDGHEGQHRDADHGESWDDDGSSLPHLLRHDDEL